MKLIEDFKTKEIEEKIKNYLQSFDLEHLIFESDSKNKKIVFIEGPPTLNGEPHAGHLRGRIFKDLWYRFNTLRGYKIIFNAGWDTQGLPVELQAEKELGIKGKSEIKNFQDVQRLVSECKKIVKKYHEKWVEVDKKLGMSFNQEKAYWTFKDDYIEKEWQLLKKAHENGILTAGHRVVAYCPSCQTSLSHSEVNQGYEMVQDPSLYYKVKMQNENLYFIVWTTMPFTLVTDAMVGLNPKEDYVHVKVEDEIWIIGNTRLKELMKEIRVEKYSVIKTVKGSELGDKKYIHPFLDKIPKLAELAEKENFHVSVVEDFVDINTGSGIVHLSPANGEEDYNIALRRKVPIFNPINDEVKFSEDAGVYSGLFVRDADERIVEDLREKGALVKIGKIKHKYPLCWRSHHKIVWLARHEYFYMLDSLGDKAVDAAQKVEYFFEPPKNRFLEIIKEKHPWCISRERFWGCPLPIWKCKNCQHVEMFFSRKDIVKAATELPDGPDFELHRPWIDNIGINCKKCKTRMEREEFVLDTWHNSGAAPFSSLTENEFKKNIPAPFLTEGIDQTRGWAYTLLIENVILCNKPNPPYRAFLFQGHVLDEKGNKMSKSTGNVIDASNLLSEFPVDLVRFYFMWKSSPIEPLNFSTKELMSRPYQVLSTLYHLHLYYKQNSEYDKFEKDVTTIEWSIKNKLLGPPDFWLLSKLQSLIIKTTDTNEKCKFHESAKGIEDFIINLLSQIYIPLTKGELWEEDETKKERRLAIYAVLAEVLNTLDILIHPLCPFTSEHLYVSCFGGKQSILLDSWPKPNKSLTNENLEESFDLMQEVVSIGAAARMKGKLKRRWPLNEAIICIAKGQKNKLEILSELLISQLNVENYRIVELENSEGVEQIIEMKKADIPIIAKLQLDRKRIGPKAQHNLGKLLEKFSQANHNEIIDKLSKENSFSFEINETVIGLEKEDFIVDFEVVEGNAFAKRNGLVTIISTTRNREMMARGLIKDLARRLQNLRKQRGYKPTDILAKASILDLEEESLQMTKEKAKELAFLVRVKEVDFSESCKSYMDEDLDGQKIRISVE